MKVIIAGGREGFDEETVFEILNVAAIDIEITEVVSGCAPGVDELGQLWASERGIPVKRFPADWNQHGKAAGPIRNEQMANYADALIAIWDGKSRGTGDMIKRAKRRGLLTSVFIEQGGLA